MQDMTPNTMNGSPDAPISLHTCRAQLHSYLRSREPGTSPYLREIMVAMGTHLGLTFTVNLDDILPGTQDSWDLITATTEDGFELRAQRRSRVMPESAFLYNTDGERASLSGTYPTPAKSFVAAMLEAECHGGLDRAFDLFKITQ